MRTITLLATIIVIALSGCSMQTETSKKMLEKIWTYDQFEQPLSVGTKVTNGKTMIVSISGIEYALIDTATGSSLWHKILDEEPGNDNNFPPVDAGDKMVFSAANQLRCVSMEDGSEIWSAGAKETDVGPASFNQPAYVDGRIYAGTSSGSLVCIDAPSGVQNWEMKSAEDAYGPTIAMGNKIICQMLSSRIECRKQDQGWVVWKNDYFRMPLAPIPNDGKILYLSNPGPSLAALDPNDMKVLWTQTIDKKSGMLSIIPVVEDSSLYCIDENTVYTFATSDGKKTGSFEIPFDPTDMKVNGKKIYISSRNILYCYDSDGKQLAQFKEPNGDRIIGIDVGKSVIICWTQRAVYGLAK
jgi:outer membrane protein assembly factor BamB